MIRALQPPLDTAARLVGIALLVTALVGTGYVTGVVKGRHEARAARERECVKRVTEAAARHRLSVVRLAMPCEAEK